MWYQIVGIDLTHRQSEDIHDEALTECKVLIVKDGRSQEIAVELDEADLRQLENLLRRKVDKTLNGE